MKLRICVGLMLAAFALTVYGAGPAGVRKRAEMSTLVTGTVDIEKDGSIGAHHIDHPDKLLPQIVRLVDKAIPSWRFEPVKVDGKIVKAHTKMSILVIANKLEDGDYRLRIGSASFGEEMVKGETVTALGEMTPPNYPTSAAMAGIQGTAYLVLKINRQGAVEDAVDEQVNLTIVGSDRQMDDARKVLAKAAKAAARKWRFDIPTRGESADEEFWSLRIPVAFALCDGPSECESKTRHAYGGWEAYIPGPKNTVPWISDEDNRQSPEAMAAGGVYPVGSSPRLVTPLTQG